MEKEVKMISRLSISNAQNFPLVLKYTDIRSYVFTAAFVLLGVFLPWVFHQFALAGPTFLPMHLFVLGAGLLFGWRMGLAVGLITPITSYAISAMPGIMILPQIVVELSAYGLIAGLLREKLNLSVFWSLLGAMVGGRLVLFIAALMGFLISGQVNSHLGLESNPFVVPWIAIRQGWPGIVIQLMAIPILIFLIEKFVIKGIKASHHE